jgi:hypothetical protein
MSVTVRYGVLDTSNRTRSNDEKFLSQRAWERTDPQGTCEYISTQCDFTIHSQELTQKIQIRRSFLRRRRAAWKTSDFSGPGSSALSEEVPFASSRVMAGHFSVDRATIKNIRDRERGLRKFTRKCLSHIVPVEQKLRRVTESQSLLSILSNLAEKNFQGISTGDESDTMLAISLAEVTARG